jgi:glutamate 5-kinase
VIVDNGAAEALSRGKSLLPAGVTKIEGAFERGDAVVIRNGDGAELGRGLAAYDHEEARRIIGRKSSELPEVLGYRGDTELIHRDDMVLHRRA